MNTEEKLDALITGQSAMHANLQNVIDTQKEIKEDMKEFTRRESEQDTHIAVLQDNVNGIGKKLTAYIIDHSLPKVIGIVLAIISVISGVIVIISKI